MKKLLLTLKDETEQKLSAEIWPRNIVLPVIKDKIHVITGIRRSGKTYYLLGKIKDKIEKGVKKTNIIHKF